MAERRPLVRINGKNKELPIGDTLPGGGGGGSANTGTVELDFGAFPGSNHASIAVTGQTAIVAGSIVQAWIRPVATVDHTADEHLVESLKVMAADIIAATGFTIHGFNTCDIIEPVQPPRLSRFSGTGQDAGAGKQDLQQKNLGGKASMIYGKWTVAWSWV